ncbi:MAG: MFS transporter [Oscillospiraceae bacterium]|nr:MFS transporter [Oscillospiraceae bacterium]MBR0393392.1 MFS transporter [Oscillospiraceae bacterium]
MVRAHEKKKFHYAWLVCAGCAVLLFCTSGLTVNAFTIYQPYILRQGGLTNAQSSLLITLRNLFSFLGMLLTGWYYRKLSLRTGMLISGLMVAASFFVYGLARSYPVYLLAATITGIGYGFGTMIPVAIVLEHWFLKERTLAIGICSAVTGLSTLGIPLLLTNLIEKEGLSWTFTAEGIAVALLAGISFLLVRDRPDSIGMKPYGAEEEHAEEEKRIYHSAGLNRRDWILIVPMLLLLGGFTSVGYSHLTVHLNALGYKPGTIAAAIMVSGIAIMAGKTGYGIVADHVGDYRTNWIFSVILLAGLLLCCIPGISLPRLFSAMCLYSFGLGLTTVGLTAWVGDWSSEDRYDANTRRFQMGYSGGALVFSALPGILADQAGGSYIPAYVFFLISAMIVVGIVQYIYRRK